METITISVDVLRGWHDNLVKATVCDRLRSCYECTLIRDVSNSILDHLTLANQPIGDLPITKSTGTQLPHPAKEG